jgi:hypothetical protein
MNHRPVLTLVAYACIVGASIRGASAAGEQVGRVRGLVSDTNRQPLPGVNIVATSPSLIGDSRTALTDDRGRYEIVNLPPGLYELEFSYPDTAPNRRQAQVRSGEAVTANVTYLLTSVGVSDLALTEARSLTRPDSTHTGSVKGMETLNRLPVLRQYQSVVQLVPGVSGGANPNIKGGLSNYNRYLIDGMDVTDPISKTFAMNLTFDSMESVEVLTGGFDAEYNALGGVINVIPKGGGDEFHAVVSAYGNHSKLGLPSNQGPNLWEYEQPFNDTKLGPEQSYEISANVGGAIIKRKLWYGATFQYTYTDASLAKGAPLGVPPYNIQHPPRTYTGYMARLRLDYAPVSKHRLRFSFNTDPATIDNTTQSNSSLGVTEIQQRQGGLFAQLRWDWFLTNNITTTVMGGYVVSGLEIGPQGRLGKVDFSGCNNFSDANCRYERDRPRRINSVDGTAWYQGGNYRTDDRYRLQLDPTVSVRGELFGRHNAKVGLQMQYLWRKRHQETPGGSVYTDSGTERLEAGLCDPVTLVGCYRRTDIDPYDIKQSAYAIGLFLQDHWWTPLSWLTVVPGLRVDYGVTYNNRKERVTRMLGLGPRLGATADVSRDGRNILFAYYGRSTDVVPLDVVAAMDETEAGATRTYQFDDTNMVWPTDPFTQTGGPGGVEVDKKPKVPRTDELTGGYRREFFPGTVTGLEYTWKRISHDWTGLEVNQIWDPTGSRVIDYVNYLDPDKKLGREVTRYTTPYSPRHYQGVVISSEGRPSARWDYHASHTVSWTTYRTTEYSNHRQARYDLGWSSADLRHYTRLQAAYYLLRNLNVGAMFQYRSQGGSTFTKAFYNYEDGSQTNWRSPSGTTPTTPNDPTGIAEFRTPALVQLDLTVRYNVLPASLGGQSLTAFVDILNAFNTRTPTGINASDLPTFGQVSGRQRPLRLQLGLSYGY